MQQVNLIDFPSIEEQLKLQDSYEKPLFKTFQCKICKRFFEQEIKQSRPQKYCSSCKNKIKYKSTNNYFKERYGIDEEWTKTFKENSRKAGKKYYQKNKKKIFERTRNRINNNQELKVITNLRGNFRMALRNYTKTGKIMSSHKYGIDYKKIMESLKPFPENLSKYHIDHIRPLCSFNFINNDGSTNLEEVKKAFNPLNLQWLLVKDNLKKSGKWNPTSQSIKEKT